MQWPKDTPPESWGIKAFDADTVAGGLSRDPKKIHTHRNSGGAAINVAYHLGAKRILLLGYDMKTQGDKRHWFGAHPGNMEVASCYESFRKCIGTIVPSQYGLEIWNLTRDTALDCFPCYDFDEICAALSSAPDLASAA